MIKLINEEKRIIKFVHSRELPKPRGLMTSTESLANRLKGFYTSKVFLDAIKLYLEATYRGMKFEVEVSELYSEEIFDSISVRYKEYSRSDMKIGPYLISVYEGDGAFIKQVQVYISNMPIIGSDAAFEQFHIPNQLTLPQGVWKTGSNLNLVYGTGNIHLVKEMKKTTTLEDLVIVALIVKAKTSGINQTDIIVDYVCNNFSLLFGKSCSKNVEMSIKNIKGSNRLDPDVSMIDAITKLWTEEVLFPISKKGKMEITKFIDPLEYEGYILAEDIGNLKKETMLTRQNIKANLTALKKKGFIKVYMKAITESNSFYKIPAGTVVDTNIYKAIQQMDPELIERVLETGIVEEDIQLKRSHSVSLEESTVSECYKTLNSVKSYSDETYIYFSNEYSIVSNTENGQSIISMLNGKVTSEEVTPEDVIALASKLIQFLRDNTSIKIQDVDADFRKDIMPPDLILVDRIKRASYMINMQTKASSYKLDFIRSSRMEESLNKALYELKKIMFGDSTLEYIDAYNVVKQSTQALKVTLKTDNVSDNARVLTLKQFGVLSPYTTPSSGKIGVTRALTKLAIFDENGQVRFPLYRVVNGIIDTSEVEYITPEDQVGKHIAYTSSFDFEQIAEDKFRITSSTVKATAQVGENYTVVETRPTMLDYVTVQSDSIFTPCELMVPCMSNNDGARILYASAMLTQQVCLCSPDVPRVMTDEYLDFTHHFDDLYVKRSNDQYLVSITNSKMLTLNDHNNIPIKSVLTTPKFLGRLPLAKRVRVTDNNFVKQREIIYDTIQTKDGILTTGKNAITAYITLDGYNIEDAFVMSERFAASCTSLSTKKKEVINSNVSLENGYYYPDNRRKYSPEIIDEDSGGVLVDSRKITKGENEVYTYDYIILDETIGGDKIVGRHGNKGTNSVIWSNDKMPVLTNNIPLDFILNQVGLYPRMNFGSAIDTKLGLIAWLLDISITANAVLGVTIEELKILESFIYELTLVDDPLKVITVAPFTDLPELMLKQAVKRHDFISMFRGVLDEKLMAEVKLSYESGQVLYKRVTIGVHYVMKLVHMASHKMKSSGINDSIKVHQLQYANGQRDGEMEIDCLEARSAYSCADEILNFRSDNLETQKMLIVEKDQLKGSNRRLEVSSKTTPYATKQLFSILESANIIVEEDIQ